MATFNFPYHTVRTKYPESGFRVQFGGNYTFTAAPEAPDARIFVLNFDDGVFQYFLDEAGQIDMVTTPERNAAVLDAFYNEHKMWKSFEYVHPVYGSLQCKFNQPLEIPEGIKGGNGTLKGFTIELLEDI